MPTPSKKILNQEWRSIFVMDQYVWDYLTAVYQLYILLLFLIVLTWLECTRRTSEAEQHSSQADLLTPALGNQ